MNDEHKSNSEILKEIELAKTKIEIGANYVHYKSPDKIYQPKEFGTLEADGTLCVIYQAQYDEKLTFIRPVSVWLEQVDWQGQTLPRFKKL